jgi:hypothetical protein
MMLQQSEISQMASQPHNFGYAALFLSSALKEGLSSERSNE